jgi:peroxiredoxin
VTRVFVGLALTIALASLQGCGSTPSTQPTYGATAAERPLQPFELSLRNTEGEEIQLADFRGRAVLLFPFATFDLPSQAALEPLQEVAREHPELTVLGIALQPDPQDLLGIFANALQVEINLAYETDNRLLRGLTDLGRIDGVPSYVLIDRHGAITKRWTGALNATALRQWCGYE